MLAAGDASERGLVVTARVGDFIRFPVDAAERRDALLVSEADAAVIVWADRAPDVRRVPAPVDRKGMPVRVIGAPPKKPRAVRERASGSGGFPPKHLRLDRFVPHGGRALGHDSHLDYRRADGALVVHPLPRVLGPWDGADGPPGEVVAFCDQLWELLDAEDGPLLLDLSGFEFARNWSWLVPLVRACSGRGRRLAVWVRPAVAEQLAVIGIDRLVPVRTTLGDALAALG